MRRIPTAIKVRLSVAYCYSTAPAIPDFYIQSNPIFGHLMDPKSLLDEAYAHVQSAEACSQSGDFHGAHVEYTKAANLLMELAGQSAGEIKVSRLEKVEQLVALAERMKYKSKEQRLQDSRKRVNANERNIPDSPSTFEELGVTVSEKSDVSFNEVAGLDDVKEEIYNKVILPMKERNLAKEYRISPGGGILLFGPPGSGKTHVARAISHEVSAKFVIINPSALLSQWFGMFEKRISQLFEIARSNSPVVLFFDEIDAIAPRRSKTNSSVMKRAVPQLLAEMDGFRRDPGSMVLVIGATNNPWDIDEALLRPGRFDEKIYVRLPEESARRRMFELSLSGRKLSPDMDYGRLASISDGFSGAEIDYICRKVAEEVFRQSVETGVARDIDEAKVEEIIGRTRKTVNDSMLKRYDEFIKSG